MSLTAFLWHYCMAQAHLAQMLHWTELPVPPLLPGCWTDSIASEEGAVALLCRQQLWASSLCHHQNSPFPNAKRTDPSPPPLVQLGLQDLGKHMVNLFALFVTTAAVQSADLLLKLFCSVTPLHAFCKWEIQHLLNPASRGPGHSCSWHLESFIFPQELLPSHGLQHIRSCTSKWWGCAYPPRWACVCCFVDSRWALPVETAVSCTYGVKLKYSQLQWQGCCTVSLQFSSHLCSSHSSAPPLSWHWLDQTVW